MQKIDERQIKDQKCDKRKVGEFCLKGVVIWLDGIYVTGLSTFMTFMKKITG